MADFSKAPKMKKTRAPERDELDALSGELDIEVAVEEHERTRSETMGSNAEFIMLADGENVLRFLPPRPGQKVPWVRYMQHRIPGSNPRGTDKDGWDRNLVCVASLPTEDGSKMACPICKIRDGLTRTASPNDSAAQANIKALKPKLRVITEVIDLTDEDTAEKGVQLFAYGSMIDESLISLLQGRLATNFTSAKTGAPVLIMREGKGIETRYKNVRVVTNEQGPIDVAYLRERVDLHKFLTAPSREDMAKAIAKLTGQRAPEEEAPRRPKATRASVPKAKPKPKAKAKEKDSEPYEYEEDFEDEDEDEDELDDEPY